MNADEILATDAGKVVYVLFKKPFERFGFRYPSIVGIYTSWEMAGLEQRRWEARGGALNHFYWEKHDVDVSQQNPGESDVRTKDQ
jgi:hypothetical protein